jgi:L-Ala-D/L-Glu epimerase / N-acetyl-D-glutamate racemase
VRLELIPCEARLRAPFVSARDSVSVRPLLLVRVEAADGAVGHGEAAPLHGYDGVTVDDVRAALEDCRPLLAEGDGGDLGTLRKECAHVAVLPQAAAAVDLALWDLEGRRVGRPVWRLLGAHEAAPVTVNATIAAPDRARAAADAAAAAARGFGCVKVKVGIGDDAGRLAAVRAAAGPRMSIRLDANGAWSVAEALASLRLLEPVGLELCEEPVSGLDQVSEVSAQTLVPVSIDETAVAPGALERRVCDAACLKITSCGGISGLLAATRRARATGYEVYLSSTLDGPLGIAAALHVAAAVRPDRPCGLATLGQFADRADPLQGSGGTIPVPSGPGLGDRGDRLVGWYRGL